MDISLFFSLILVKISVSMGFPEQGISKSTVIETTGFLNSATLQGDRTNLSILWPESRTGSTAVSTAGLKLCDKNGSPIRMVRSPWGLGVYHAIMGLQEEFSNMLSELGILRSMEEGGERWLGPARGAARIVSQRVHWASLPRE